MKNLLLIALLALPILAISQGTNCADMDPICTDVGAQFTANTGTTAEPGNDYGCLLTQPNPSWYYFEVATNGNIDMSLTAPSDIDFIIWGPYPNLAAAQANCGTLGSTNQVDCSFSATNNETPSIPNAQAGEVYIMLITNYANVTQNITLTQTGGTGSTDCSIVTNPPCFMSFFEANISACDALTDTYEVTGYIDFEDPPTTGDLIVEDCNGNQVVVASAPFTVNALGEGSETYVLSGLPADGLGCDVSAYFSADPGCSISNLTYTAPECLCFFTFMQLNQEPCNTTTNTFDVTGSLEFDSPPTTGVLTLTDCNGETSTYFPPFVSPLTWSLTGITPNGSVNCDVTAQFSDDPACNITVAYNHPQDCNCPVDAGSFTPTIAGNSTAASPFDLCFGDVLTVTPNGDFIPPTDIGNNGTFTYNPGMWFLIYDCQPTIVAPNDFTTDPCLLGTWNSSSPTGPWTVDNIYGDNSTYWFVPLTFYDYVNGVYSYFAAGTLCYDMGPAYQVTFLEPIVTNTVEDCNAGTATTTINGGTPSYDGSLFNVVPGTLVPSTASFVNTSAPEGGTITISGLVDGDAYSFDIIDDNGCPVTVSGTFQGLEDASFSYDFKYCVDDADPLPVITGVPGGDFTASPAGMVINQNTGLIDLSATTPGIYTITYESPAATCFGTETFVVNINDLPAVIATEDSPICDDGISAINLGETGGEATEWAWTTSGSATISDPTLQNPVVSNATNGEVFTVTVIDANTGCSNSDNVTVTVTPLDNPSFTLTDFCFGTANAATVTGTTGGTFSFNPDPFDGAIVNASTGEITNEVAGTTYSIQYLTGGACPDSLTQTVTVNILPTINANDETICLGGSVSLTATGGTSYTWSPGTYLNTTTGATVTSTPAADILYTITGTDANGCQNTATSNVTVQGNAPINAGNDTTICSGQSVTLTATGGATYTWDQGLGAGNNFVVSPALTTTYTVNGTDANGCTGADQIVVTVNPVPTVNPVANQTVCANSSVAGINFSGSVPGTTYDWVNSNATIGLAAAGTGNIAGFTGVNAGTSAITATVTVTPTLNGCTGTPINFTITINPIPVLNPITDQTLCNGVMTAPVNFSSATSGTTFAWTNNNTAIGLGSNASGNIGAFSATNNGTSPISGTITVTPTANGCQGTPESFDIIVNPSPVVAPITDQTLCNGVATAAVNFSSATPGATFSWTNNTTSIGLGASGNGNIASFNATNTGTTQVTATILVSASANGCLGPQESFDIIVNPTPTVNAISDQEICAGANTNAINFSGGVTGTQFDWSNSNTGIGLGANGTGNIGAFTGVNNSGAPISGTVSVTPTAAGCVGIPTNFIITINPLPTATISGTASVCVGGTNPVLTLTGSNGVAPYTFTYNINGGTPIQVVSTGNSATINVPTTAAGTYNYNLVSVSDASATNCSQNVAGTATITVNDNPTPVITGTLTYCTGTSATLSTSQAYTSYIWSTGATTASANVTIADNPITVQVTNAFGCVGTSAAVNVVENTVIVYNTVIEICQGETATIHGQVQSVAGTYDQTFILPTGCDSTSSVELIVNPLPVIDAGTDQVACEGTAITLNATGASTIAWDVVGVNNGTPFTQAVGQVTYTATGTDANGCVNTDDVLVTINPTPDVNPITDQTICNGAQTTAVNFSGSVPGTTYSWVNNTPSIGLAANGNGNMAAFTGTNNTAAPVIATITVTPTANGCPGTSETFTITINPTPVANPILDQTLCNGSLTAALTFSSTTAGTTFDWTNNTTSIGLAANGTGNIGAFAATNTGTSNVTATISVTPTANGCAGTAEDFTITVNPSPVVDAILDQTVCDGASTANVTITSATAGTTFDWTNNNPSIGLAGTGSGNIAAFTGTNAGSAAISGLITVTPTANGCTGPTEDFTITVNPAPTVNTITDQIVCNGAGTSIVNFSSSTAGTSFDWTNNDPSIGLAANGSGNIASFTATNNGTSAVIATISVTPTANGCPGVPVDFTITVNPTPNVDPILDQSVCDGSNTAAVNFTSTTANTTFSWANNNASIGLGASGTGSIAAFTGQNSGATPVSGTITVTPEANGCAGPTETFVITVNPTPTVNPILDDEVCVGELTQSVNFGGNMPGATYTWTNNTPSIGLAANGTGDIASFAGVNGGATPVTATITVTPDANGCVGNAEQFTITVNPLPVVFAGADFVVCEGSTAILTATGATNYVWSPNVGNGVVFTPTATQIYTVTGTDANGCVNTDDVLVTVEPIPVISFVADVTSGCAPLEVTFTNTTQGNITDCIWTFGNGATIAGCGPVTTTFPNGGLYDVTLSTTTSNGCTNSETYIDYIYVEDAPIAAFTPSTSVGSLFNSEIYFDNNSTGAVNYEWDFGDNSPISTVENPLHLFPNDESGVYTVTLTAYSPLGCIDTVSATITINEELIFYVPNTFTPDSDDFNEYFQPVFSSGYDPFDFNLYIFNRWGEIIWESHDASVGWDGTYGTDGREVQDGTYTWKIDFKTTLNDERVLVVGHVNVLR